MPAGRALLGKHRQSIVPDRSARERLLREAAEAERIPYQTAGDPGQTGTDAWAMQVVRSGLATGLLSVPLRYMHTPSEVLSLTDLENASRILAAFIKRLAPKTSFIPEA